MTTAELNALYDRRSEPGPRAVLDDYLRETATPPARLGVAIWLAADDADAAVDAAAAATADAAADDADAAVDAAAAATADAAADDADAAVDAAADDADAGIPSLLTKLLTTEPDMRDGLKVVQVPGRYGYSVTRVGYLRRIAGDEWELCAGARTVVRTQGYRTLDSLATKGPEKDHRLEDAAEGPEEVHRLVIRRSLPASEAAWAKHIERPADWGER